MGGTLAQQKLAAFEQLQPEFEASFRFVQEVHGQQRFAAFPVQQTVQYLHALWVCECKDRLLGMYKNSVRHEGCLCLDLLRRWQTGETAEVIAFLQRKLDGLPFADLTYQLQQARIVQQADNGVAQRLVHGRQVLLNRGINLMQALDAIFALSEQDLMGAVREACEHYEHHPDQIEQQLAERAERLYAYAPHQLLAQRNMLVMNTVGVAAMTLPADLPGERSWKVVAPTEPLRPFAEHIVAGYVELTSPTHNNIKFHHFVDRPEQNHGVSV
jgi:hypothetical protein